MNGMYWNTSIHYMEDSYAFTCSTKYDLQMCTQAFTAGASTKLLLTDIYRDMMGVIEKSRYFANNSMWLFQENGKFSYRDRSN